MNKELLQALEWLLNAVKNGNCVFHWPSFSIENNVFIADTAICGNVQAYFDHSDMVFHHEELMQEIFPRWPKFSGHLEFPVPAHVPYLDAESCFYKCPLWVGKYGQLRLELLEFMIQELKNAPTSL